MKNRLLLLAAISFLLSCCEKDKGPYVNAPVLPEDTASVVSFKAGIQPIFDTYCIRCHVQTHPLLDMRASFSYDQLLYEGAHAPYVDTLNPENSILLKRLRGVSLDHMPPEPPDPPDTKIELIKKWMSQGAQNN